MSLLVSPSAVTSEELGWRLYWNILSIVFKLEFSLLKQKPKPLIAEAVCLVFEKHHHLL